jgi:putative CocE/NonD family hydrolase
VHRQNDVRLKWGIRIPLRDSVQLHATLYTLHDQPSAPAIFVLTPYVAQVHHDQAVYFAARGYSFLTVDVRGRGNSEGEFHPLNEAGTDGYDVVEWIARQPWCDGHVAMWGASYSGYAQWTAARHVPPHLATIIPVAAPFRGVDSPMSNNIFTPYVVRWLTLLSGRTAQDRIAADMGYWKGLFRRSHEVGIPFNQLDTFVGNPSPIFQEWISHPEQDAYWDSYNPSPQQYSQLSIPILTITGAYDSDQHGALTHYRQHVSNTSADGRARHYLVIGPWDHAGSQIPKAEFAGIKIGPAGVVDLAQLQCEWYAWIMRGGPRPPFLQKNVAYYVTGAERWRYADSLEAVTSRTTEYYLHSTSNPTDVFSSGSLVPRRPPDGQPDHYVYDPHDVSHAEIESTMDVGSLVDQRLIHACRGKHLVYHSEPFATDTEISGFFTLTVWLAIDQPDTDFRVSIHDVGVDGRVVLLTSDSLRARYRENLRVPKRITLREPLSYTFERFTFVSRLVRKGHRLRMVFGPIHSIFSQKNYNGGGVVSAESMSDARVVAVKLFHGRSYPSVLCVPLGQPEDR